jgi:hypothetical protein
MKNCILAFSIFLSFQTLSYAKNLDWNEIELYNRYSLNYPISFLGTIEFKVGDRFEVLSANADGGPVLYYQFHFIDCKNPTIEAEMILINHNPADTSRDRSIGVELERGCNLGIYLEPLDMYSSSIFKQ